MFRGFLLRVFAADRLLQPVVKILQENIRLERRAGFARHDEECFANVDLLFNRRELAPDQWNPEREIQGIPRIAQT